MKCTAVTSKTRQWSWSQHRSQDVYKALARLWRGLIVTQWKWRILFIRGNRHQMEPIILFLVKVNDNFKLSKATGFRQCNLQQCTTLWGNWSLHSIPWLNPNNRKHELLKWFLHRFASLISIVNAEWCSATESCPQCWRKHEIWSTSPVWWL